MFIAPRTLLVAEAVAMLLQGFLSRSTLAFSPIAHSSWSLKAQTFGRFNSQGGLCSFTDRMVSTSSGIFSHSEGQMPDSQASTEVRVVTFDLDNTLWNTSACISTANDILAEHLASHRIEQPMRVEKLMGQLFLENRAKYAPLEDNAKEPVLLTKLRTEAIQYMLVHHNNFSPEKAKLFATEAFELWTKARHDAIPDHYASNVLECLEKISSIRTSGHPILVGAITDGNSDPRQVGTLGKYFDFCVNAEAVGVGKPDKRLYMEAIRYVAAHPMVQDLDILPNEPLPFWVHVGDDFIKDIFAAKTLDMKTVWATELVRTMLDSKLQEASLSDHKEEFVQALRNSKLADLTSSDSKHSSMAAGGFVDAVTEEFHHLSDVLLGWTNNDE